MTVSISMTKGAKASTLTIAVDDVFENANNSNTSEFYIKDR